MCAAGAGPRLKIFGCQMTHVQKLSCRASGSDFAILHARNYFSNTMPHFPPTAAAPHLSIPSPETTVHLILMQDLREGLRSPFRLSLGQLHVPQALLAESLGIRIQPQEHLLVLQRVLFLDAGALGQGASLGGTHDGLHLRRVDQTADVGVCHHVGGEEKIFLQGRGRGG